jgi:hypothetical protein
MRKELNRIMNEEYHIVFVDRPEWEIIGRALVNTANNKQVMIRDKVHVSFFKHQAKKL